MALTDKLTSIADAIRTQTDTTDKMTLDEMPEKISKLGDVNGYFNTNVKLTSKMSDNINRIFIKKLPDLVLDCTDLGTVDKIDAISRLFSGYVSLTEIPNVDLIGYELPYTSYESIILNCNKLTNVENLKKLFARYEADNLTYLFSDSALNNDIIKDIVSSIKPISQNYGNSDGGNLNAMFFQCKTVTEINIFDTTNYVNFGQMFYNCSNLVTINNTIDMSNAYRYDYMLFNCPELKNVSIKNLGKTKPESTTINLGFQLNHKITHASLISILEGLYDISQTDWSGTTFKLGSYLLSILSDEEKKVATDKGWILS